MFISTEGFALCCYLLIENNVSKNVAVLSKYCSLMRNQGESKNRIWKNLGFVLIQWKSMWDNLEIWHFHPNLVYTFKNFCFVNLPFNICYVFHLSSQMSKIQREPKSFIWNSLFNSNVSTNTILCRIIAWIKRKLKLPLSGVIHNHKELRVSIFRAQARQRFASSSHWGVRIFLIWNAG